jgi:hypothetical protein
MKTASWVLLAMVGVLILLGALGSAWIAYSGARDELGAGGATVEEVRAWRGDAATAIQARRGTAAAFAGAYVVLFLSIVLGPYRRGEVWSWWALLAGAITLAILTLPRINTLGTWRGVGTPLTHLGVVVVALLLDVRRLRAPAAR